MTEIPTDQQILELIIKAIVNNPEAVKVERKIDEMGVLLSLKVDPQDMAQIIGRQGATAKALRTILKVVGAKNRARVNLKIEEPPGGSFKENREADKVADNLVEDLKF
ncbi:MAG: KH domain-containing protein [Candidatus Paceibacterota bacterium]|nr:KH domain-containing protein [Candidatus Paceibacterota bacterium]MDD4999251.1 KH domain-containing protein [Candidatus Paceibacterota bacterium]MDD5545391.1 KH domain-containing protein [Candidatus Paceibacterota bacterium]